MYKHKPDENQLTQIERQHGSVGVQKMKASENRRTSSSNNVGGIQKASGIGDMFSSPIKGVTDSGLARSKYTLQLEFNLRVSKPVTASRLTTTHSS